MSGIRNGNDNSWRNHMTDRILHIDDDRIVLDLVQAIFRDNEQIAVTSRTNAEDALASIQSLRPDLIIVDIAMPNMGGVEFTHQLRKIPQSAHTPIIILSGRAQNLRESIIFQEMTPIVLEKPVDPDRLRYEAKTLLARAKSIIAPRSIPDEVENSRKGT